SLRQDPSQRNLCWRASLIGRQFLDPRNQSSIVGKVLGLKSRMGGAAVAHGRQAFDAARKKAATERRVKHQAKAELAGGLPRFLGLGPVEERVFSLYRRDGMHLMRAPDGIGFCLRQAQEPHLALLDESAHGTHRLFDLDAWVDAVLVIDINHLYA